MNQESLLLRPDEVADALQVSRSKAYELLASGVLPSFRIGRNLRVSRAALERWIAQQSSQAHNVFGIEEAYQRSK